MSMERLGPVGQHAGAVRGQRVERVRLRRRGGFTRCNAPGKAAEAGTDRPSDYCVSPICVFYRSIINLIRCLRIIISPPLTSYDVLGSGIGEAISLKAYVIYVRQYC